MYLDMKNLECHCNQEGDHFLAYIDLGKDENGKRVRPKTRGRSEDEAVAKLEKKLRDLGYVQPEPDAPPLDMIISQFTPIPEFVKEFKVNHLLQRVKDGEIESRTVENYGYNLKQFETYFQRMTVGEITTSHLNQFFKTQAMTYAQVTLNRIEFVVHLMFKRALGKGWIQQDPFTSSEYRKAKAQKKTQAIQGFDAEELKNVLQVMEKYPIIHVPICLLLHTGMRTQEVLALQWKHIDFQNNTIQVERAVTIEVEFDDKGQPVRRKSVIGKTKTVESQRVIGLTAEARELLLHWRQLAPTISMTKLEAEHFVFGSEQKDHFSYGAFRTKVNRFLEKQPECEDSLRLHRFRHTIGTLLAAEGREILQIKKQLGVTKDDTLRRYIDTVANQKIIADNRKAVSNGLSGMFGGAASKPNTMDVGDILRKAEDIEDSKAKAIIQTLLTMVREG